MSDEFIVKGDEVIPEYRYVCQSKSVIAVHRGTGQKIVFPVYCDRVKGPDLCPTCFKLKAMRLIEQVKYEMQSGPLYWKICEESKAESLSQRLRNAARQYPIRFKSYPMSDGVAFIVNEAGLEYLGQGSDLVPTEEEDLRTLVTIFGRTPTGKNIGGTRLNKDKGIVAFGGPKWGGYRSRTGGYRTYTLSAPVNVAQSLLAESGHTKTNEYTTPDGTTNFVFELYRLPVAEGEERFKNAATEKGYYLTQQGKE